MQRSDYYKSQLDNVKPNLTQYAPTVKIFANGNGQDTKHLSLNNESAKELIKWLENNFPNCKD
jgi:hypothetical protein